MYLLDYLKNGDKILTIISFAKSVTLLVEILMAESQNAIKWFSENKMIVTLTNLNQLLFRKVVKRKPKQFLRSRLRSRFIGY